MTKRKPFSEMDLVDRLDADNEPGLDEEFQLTEHGQPDYNYSELIIPEVKRVLAKNRYTYYEALHRFTEIAEAQDLVLYRIIETARYYVFECFARVKEVNE